MTRIKNTDKICEINLTNRTTSTEIIDPEILRMFSGGRGYNAWFLFKHLQAGVDALGAENILLFTCGQLTGTPAPVSSRLHISALSPQTGLLGSANVGGTFGARLRASDFLSLILRGRSETQVLLVLQQGACSFVDAGDWWGLDTWQTHDRIQEHFGPQTQALCIGLAGEHLVPFACIMHGLDHAAGRTGLGAVMGSKQVKGIVIPKASDSHKFSFAHGNESSRRFVRRVKQSPNYKAFARHGGAGSVLWCNDLGIMPTRNYQQNRFQEAERIDGRLLESATLKRTRCSRCFIGCKAELDLKDRRFPGLRANRPEFEPMVNLGARCGLSDIKALVYLDNLCSRLGLDCISAAGVLAFAMELFEKKILTPADTAGLEIHWGDWKIMETLLNQIARQQGFGKVLGQGVSTAASQIGRGATAYAYHAKGLEISAYHPSEIRGTALGYAVSSRGGDFNTLYASMEYNWTEEQAAQAFGSPEAVHLKGQKGKGQMIKRAAIVNAALDSLGLCKIPTLSLLCDFSLEQETELFRAVSGEVVTAGQLLDIGERIINLERLFNCRRGAGRDDDSLPDYFFQQGSRNDNWLHPLVLDYYSAMGWDEQGRPMAMIMDQEEGDENGFASDR